MSVSVTPAADEDALVARRAARLSLRKVEVHGVGVLFAAGLLSVAWRDDVRTAGLVVWCVLIAAGSGTAVVLGRWFRRVDARGDDWTVHRWRRAITGVCAWNGVITGMAPFVLLAADARTEVNLLFFGAGAASCCASALGSQVSLHGPFVAYVTGVIVLPSVALLGTDGQGPLLAVGLLGLSAIVAMYHVENHRTVIGEIRLQLRNAELAQRLQSSYDEIFRMNHDMARTNAALHVALGQINDMATTDPLTGAYNRRWFEERLDTLVQLFDRIGEPLSLLVFDLDHFKAVNDRFGHPAGDEVLRDVAGAVLELLGETGELARTGGEEFAVLLPGTGPVTAGAIAEELRTTVRAVVPGGRPELAVTTSIGLATLVPGQRPGDLVAAADAQLYRAKEAGRDRVRSATSFPDTTPTGSALTDTTPTGTAPKGVPGPAVAPGSPPVRAAAAPLAGSPP